jgi:hypothetical protein
MTTDNFCFYLQNRPIQTSRTGGQWYSDTPPLVFPTYALSLIPHVHTYTLEDMIYEKVCVPKCVCMCMCIHVYVCVCASVCACVRIHGHPHTPTHMYVYIYIYIYGYTLTHSARKAYQEQTL